MANDDYYWQRDFEELDKEFDLRRLRSQAKTCRDRIENAMEYENAIDERIALVESVKFRPYVRLNKGTEYRCRTTNTVQYSSNAFLVPISSDGQLLIESRIFPDEIPGRPALDAHRKGHHNERALVVQHAVDLAKNLTYNGKPATIITNLEFYKKELSVIEGLELIELPKGWYRYV